MKRKFTSKTELKKEMLNVCVQYMEAFQSDVVLDMEQVDELAERKRDGWFYWAVRKCGTHTRSTCTEFDTLVGEWGENEVIIKALIGHSVKGGYYEILYTKHPAIVLDEEGNEVER